MTRIIIKALILISVFLFGFCTGIIVLSLFPKLTSQSFSEKRDREGFAFINPLLECNRGEWINQDHNLNSLRKSITDYIDRKTEENKITFASVYYRNLDNGQWFGINENEAFSPSSLIKIPFMISYLKLAESDPKILSDSITNTLTYDYPKSQAFVPEITIAPNETLSVSQLIERMIKYSDNLAYELLLKHIDNRIVFDTFEDFDIDVSTANRENPHGNIISVKDYSSFFRILYNASYLSKKYSEKALALLAQTTFDKGISAPIPKTIAVSHKYGEREYTATGEKQLHDCGIIYAPKSPYLLCVMTRGNDFSELVNVIRNISQLIYSDTTGK